MKVRQKYQSPWALGWREKAWARLNQRWDLIVIGGGITGAGILAVASRLGLRVLLVEQGDFAIGTSSRSSKMVHGGLRYLKQFQIRLTRESVQERQYLLRKAPGLVEPLGFIYPSYDGTRPSPWLMEVGLGVYTRLAPEAGEYRRLDPSEVLLMAPGLTDQKLIRGFHYTDAQTDDARLVLRVLHDGLMVNRGKTVALNYARIVGLLREKDKVIGVRLKDETTGDEVEVLTEFVINATGAWSDQLRGKRDSKKQIRPLRGSHLYFSSSRFPIYQAIAFSHPDDERPVFVFPWEGVTLVGTTDVDHEFPLDKEPSISVEEADYLLRAVEAHFPDLELTKSDVLSTQAGVRPVVDTGKADPSSESRDHVLWSERGMLTVTGGKLTTFRMIAIDALQEAHDLKKKIREPSDTTPALEIFDASQTIFGVDSRVSRRFWGRYGAAAPFLTDFPNELLSPVPGTPYLWSEFLWAAKHEAVCHLDDLMLRRFRLGILLPDGGLALLERLKKLIQEPLGWNDERWEKEVARYKTLWKIAHGLPSGWQ
jgi:glycerol-3-phosphate dehydrogenase